MPRSRRTGDLDELPAAVVLEHAIGNQQRQFGAASAEVHVEPAVVVEIGEVAPHRDEDLVEAGLFRHVLKALATQVAIESIGRLRGIRGVRP